MSKETGFFRARTMESIIERVSRHDLEFTEVEIPRNRNHSGTNNDITQDEPIRLVEALKRNPSVRKIDFNYARRSAELFRQLALLFRVNMAIQYIRLPFETNNEELMVIEETLGNNTTVATLHLCSCDIRGRQGGEIIRRVLLSNGTITEINLDHNVDLGADGAVGLAQALRNKRCVLKKLDLWLCGIGNDGARELSNAVGNNKVLEELCIGSNTITFTGFGHVMDMLETNSCLRILDLHYNRLDQDRTGHETAGYLLARALQRNASLRELDLSICCLLAADLSSVFQTLAGDNQTLARLNIANNKMDEASAKKFARCLPEWKGLRDIYFSWYKGVSDTVLCEFLEGLFSNNRLVRIQAMNVAALQGEGSTALWRTWSEFVTSRNKMHHLLEGSGEEEASGGHPVQPLPRSILPHLLEWCSNRSRYGNESTEARASLIHHVLCARSNDICECVKTTTAKRPAREG